ncbi:hypothetical protein K432DRAFT_330829 [Lepidopterella palustris CBS 459.81]|uniref:Uncharacterized protein n=1 Tax=Lepidopterella palustris CBS 459.81 TaxID=1314670 RepID=A0A8E2JE58_9PEZI|nr:hypothetical protein K432DRAFT_330829 [Lepidopterella palustris CBS 459.81]
MENTEAFNFPSDMFFNTSAALDYSRATERQNPSQPSHLGFSFPAADEDQLDACYEHAGAARSNLCDPLIEAALPAIIPRPGGPMVELPYPEPDVQPEFNFVNLPGNGLFGASASLPSPPIPKAGRALRLPSFDLLGIGAPHPDRIVSNCENPFTSLGAGPLSKPEDPLHALSPALSRPRHLGGVGDPPTFGVDDAELEPGQVRTFIPTITPPAEPGTITWGNFANVKTAAMDSSPKSDPAALSTPHDDLTPTAPSAHPTSQEVPSLGQTSSAKPWIDMAKNIIIGHIASSKEDCVKVLSHALPCPSRVGHVFPVIIDAIHGQTPDRHTSWVNVFHAVPGRFNLADLPTSPPTTPGPAIGGDDYFTTKVFDSAVAVSDYQGDSKLLPSSPRPVVAPLTVNVSIVERYIPPINTYEFAELFSTAGRSLLLDRLIELSPNNGVLLFAYPTRTGGRTFMNEYLGPILDPLLRSMAVVHNLSADLGNSLGHMTAVEHLLEYRLLKSRMEKFCHHLSTNSSTLEKFQKGKVKFELIYSSKEEVMLDRQVWATDWWIKQEKPRVRTAVTKCFRISHKLPADSEVMPTNLIQEILDGVASRQYVYDAPKKGVEIGVFIIRKSQS